EPDLAQKAVRIVTAARPRAQHLDGDWSRMAAVGGAVDDGHSAASDLVAEIDATIGQAGAESGRQFGRLVVGGHRCSDLTFPGSGTRHAAFDSTPVPRRAVRHWVWTAPGVSP